MDIGQLTRVLVRPMVTERSTILQEQNKYVFEVTLESNRGLVKQAVEKLFDVEVIRVNTIRIPGKTKRFGPRKIIQRAKKKAIVTLKAGDKIAIFEGI